jgi:cation transport regulator ChaB
MLTKMEETIVSFTRSLFVVAAWLLLVGGAIFYSYHAIQLLSLSPDTVSEPGINSEFTPPDEGPIERQERLKRLGEAKTSFESKETDASEQVRLASKSARDASREIAGRYNEYMVKDENSSIKRLTELASDREGEFGSNCDAAAGKIDSAIKDLEDSLLKIATLHNVDPDDISDDHLENLEQRIRLPYQCKAFDKVIVAIASNYTEAFPSNFGLEGENTKMQLKSDLSELYVELMGLTDDEYTAQVFRAAISFSDDIKKHYVKEQNELDERNMLTTESAELLSESISQATNAYFIAAVEAFKDYQERKEEALAKFAAGKLISLTAMSSAIVLWAVLIGLILLIVVFAMERHQRKLTLLEKLDGGDLKSKPTTPKPTPTPTQNQQPTAEE